MIDGGIWDVRSRKLGDESVEGRPEIGFADGDDAGKGRARFPAGARMLREGGVADHQLGAARRGEIGDLVGRLTKIRRHIDRADAKTGEHRLEHLIAVLGLHQDAVALFDTEALDQRRRDRADPAVELGPSPGRVSPDEGRALLQAASGLGQEMGEIGDPARLARDAAGGIDRVVRAQWARSRIET